MPFADESFDLVVTRFSWNSLGRFVKRGEKGILILAPMISRKKTSVTVESTADAKEATAQL